MGNKWEVQTLMKRALYAQIIDHYKSKILNKEILPDEQLPTEMEMADLFGVSRITTKRALEELERDGFIYRKRGQGSFVLPVSQEKKSTGNRLVAIVIPTNDRRGRRIDYIRGATEYLNQAGYYLVVQTTDDSPELEREMLANLVRNGIQGIIYYPTSRSNFDVLYQLVLDQYPIVIIDKYFDALPLNYVVSDNFKGGYMAAAHLIKHGHRRIAFLSNPYIENISSVQDRFFGFCSAMKDNGIPVSKDNILLGLWDKVVSRHQSEEETIEFYKGILTKLKKDGVTAIFAENDYIALFAAKVLRLMGLCIPDDMSIVGFDNIELMANMDLQLTTMDQDFYQIGKMAGKAVVDRMEGKNLDNEIFKVPVKLLERGSVADLTASECSIAPEGMDTKTMG
jgi:GntR family transcriptional regulator of arabinose operon